MNNDVDTIIGMYMGSRLSVLIVDPAKGYAAKQLNISKLVIKFVVLVVIVVAAAAGFVSYGYMQVKDELSVTAGKISSTGNKIVSQESEIKFQREQIQAFAEEVESLKGKLAQLTVMENQIREATRIINPDLKPIDEVVLYGMGGPRTAEMDITASLDEKPTKFLVSMHQELDMLNSVADYRQESLQSLLQGLVARQNLMSSTPSILPIASGKHVITSKFGYRKSPFSSARSFHSGLDISAKIGTPIIATAAGKVIQSSWKGDYGYMITIDHGYGVVTRYAHCSELKLEVGTKVFKGDVVALVGNTGRSTGPHLHYEVLLNGVFVNPEKYINK